LLRLLAPGALAVAELGLGLRRPGARRLGLRSELGAVALEPGDALLRLSELGAQPAHLRGQLRGAGLPGLARGAPQLLGGPASLSGDILPIRLRLVPADRVDVRVDGRVGAGLDRAKPRLRARLLVRAAVRARWFWVLASLVGHLPHLRSSPVAPL